MLLGNILQLNVESLKELPLNQFIKMLLQNLNQEKNVKQSVKLLALCSQNDSKARDLIFEEKNGKKMKLDQI